MSNSPTPQPEYSELTLRRFRAGELSDAESLQIEQATARDSALRVRLRALADEQSAFESDIPFERFVGGVSRAQRESARKRLPRKAPLFAAGTALAAAAALVLVLSTPRPHQGNRTKGNDDTFTSYVRVAQDNGDQRLALPGKPTALRPGDRVRVGVHLRSGTTYFAAISVEPSGATTAIYPEGPNALKLVATKEPMYMPDSVQFTGQGEETLLILTAPQPFGVQAVAEALKSSPRDFSRLGASVPGLGVTPYPLRKP